ncbi:MAG: four helix bundle protein [Acidobacteriia bacterium]|nr:four helix bundle protein [Terriglobia bacterium]
MTPDELRGRTKSFALRIVKLYRALPKTPDAQVLGKQLLRCGTSVAANYRASCRARSRAEFAARIGIVVEEADESGFWLEMLADGEIVREELLKDLLQESKELTAIFTATRQSVRGRK